MNRNLLELMRIARKQKSLMISADSYQDAYNRRQRFYRLREQIRKQRIPHDLYPRADDFHFEVRNSSLVITYNSTDRKILEKAHDNQASNS